MAIQLQEKHMDHEWQLYSIHIQALGLIHRIDEGLAS